MLILASRCAKLTENHVFICNHELITEKLLFISLSNAGYRFLPPPPSPISYPSQPKSQFSAPNFKRDRFTWFLDFPISDTIFFVVHQHYASAVGVVLGKFINNLKLPKKIKRKSNNDRRGHRHITARRYIFG